jgi:hypothetical protein
MIIVWQTQRIACVLSFLFLHAPIERENFLEKENPLAIYLKIRIQMSECVRRNVDEEMCLYQLSVLVCWLLLAVNILRFAINGNACCYLSLLSRLKINDKLFRKKIITAAAVAGETKLNTTGISF